jgi:hypothetical protein
MAIGISTLPSRSPAALRAFVSGQRVRVVRKPDNVTEPNPPDDYGDDYWRFLLRRTSLEGTCLLYQTYDNSGDENDWNLNIAPDTAHAWLLDPAVLYALSTTSGAPEPVDWSAVKSYHGVPVIECELTPDDALHDKFTADALPIGPGVWLGAGGRNQGQGPTCAPVGVYGVFCGDYGHGGRPEIHPFDAFWRRYHEPNAAALNWDLGVFQDDSNRFNGDWSKPPIVVEFKVPFCLDFPVTMTAATTALATFTLRKSPRCALVAKNPVSSGVASVTASYSGRTVRLRPTAENVLNIVVTDASGVSPRRFDLSVTDVHRTSVPTLGGLRRSVWLSGYLVLEVAVGQDGFAYWNFIGPNSVTASTVPDASAVEIPPADTNAIAMAISDLVQPKERARPQLRLVEARSAPREQFSAVIVHQEADGRQLETVARPREETVVDVDGERVSLGSFDFFARAAVARHNGTVKTSSRRLDVSAAMLRHGPPGFEDRLRATPADVEVDDTVHFDVVARFSPFRQGLVFGEEQSELCDILTARLDALDVQLSLHLTSPDGQVRELVDGDEDLTRMITIESQLRRSKRGVARRIGFDLEGQPVELLVSGVAKGPSGLSSEFRAHVCNYRIKDPRAWLEQAMATSLDEWRARAARRSRDALRLATDESVSKESIAKVAAETLEKLVPASSTSALRVAGIASLLARAEQLLKA